MNLILYDDERRDNFLPLTDCHPVADLLTGFFNNHRRWELHFGQSASTLTVEYLQQKFPLIIDEDNLLVNGRVIPNHELVKELRQLKKGQKLITSDGIVGMRLEKEVLANSLKKTTTSEKLSRLQFERMLELSVVRSANKSDTLDHIWHLFTKANTIFERDAGLIDKTTFSDQCDESNTVFGKNILIHEGAKVRASILNANTGPIVIDNGAEIMEGSLIRGPVYIGKNSVVKMGTRIYGPVSIGEFAKVGGELSSTVVHSFSNKGHDGFIGHTVIGEWCNLGADTNTSNLKNDYGLVKIWDIAAGSFVDSGQQFLGLIMGDHSKCSINTMFNTGTVVGTSCNIFGSGFHPKFIPSFSWGGQDEFTEYRFEKALEVAKRMMNRRGRHLDGDEELILKEVFQMTQKFQKGLK